MAMFVVSMFTETGRGYMYCQPCATQHDLLAAKAQLADLSPEDMDLIGSHVIGDPEISDPKSLARLSPYFQKFTPVDSLAALLSHRKQARSHLQRILRRVQAIHHA